MVKCARLLVQALEGGGNTNRSFHQGSSSSTRQRKKRGIPENTGSCTTQDVSEEKGKPASGMKGYRGKSKNGRMAGWKDGMKACRRGKEGKDGGKE